MGRQQSGKFSVPRLALAGVALAVVALAAVAALGTTSAPATDQLSAPMWVNAPSSTLTGRDITLSGGIAAIADLGGTVVKVYKREVGESTDTFVADATVTYGMMTPNTFQAIVPGVTRSCIITVTWAGNADYLATSTWMFAGVRPRLSLVVKSATRKLTRFRLTVSPEQPFYPLPLEKRPFIADVQCRVRGVWTAFPAGLGGTGTDGTSWCTYSFYNVKPGKYLVRAHFKGTNYNVPGVSSPQRIVVP